MQGVAQALLVKKNAGKKDFVRGHATKLCHFLVVQTWTHENTEYSASLSSQGVSASGSAAGSASVPVESRCAGFSPSSFDLSPASGSQALSSTGEATLAVQSAATQETTAVSPRTSTLDSAGSVRVASVSSNCTSDIIAGAMSSWSGGLSSAAGLILRLT
eukprot:CAMPEP_0194509870 /NCGR_PEP_ID=MMETSP0253-20130528/41043_1 /TAXON_ID=2966 /ORGANISM="Noctiluca scintillans" /LENGTH=159 /DNA_ID=CAMNT_0039353071 /DNA_START=65 /DNA_END=544 /DNA_ORIENTATION=-